jgi:transposase
MSQVDRARWHIAQPRPRKKSGWIPENLPWNIIKRPHRRDHPVQIYVATLGAPSFSYAEATWSQKLPDRIGAHVRAFAYFGGATRQTVSDNLKAGITKALFHEPMVNRTYADMARHYL